MTTPAADWWSPSPILGEGTKENGIYKRLSRTLVPSWKYSVEQDTGGLACSNLQRKLRDDVITCDSKERRRRNADSSTLTIDVDTGTSTLKLLIQSDGTCACGAVGSGVESEDSGITYFISTDGSATCKDFRRRGGGRRLLGGSGTSDTTTCSIDFGDIDEIYVATKNAPGRRRQHCTECIRVKEDVLAKVKTISGCKGCIEWCEYYGNC